MKSNHTNLSVSVSTWSKIFRMNHTYHTLVTDICVYHYNYHLSLPAARVGSWLNGKCSTINEPTESGK